jgi:hypothetical protein
MLLTVTAVLAGPPARAQEAAGTPPPPPAAAAVSTGTNGFGAPGVWVFTFETADPEYGSAFLHKTVNGGTTVQVNPGADYFLAPNVSVGANLFFSHATGSGSDVGAAVRVGYNLAIVEKIGFWPTARFWVIHYGGSMPSTGTTFGVLAPFLWHPTNHFFLGGGPDLTHGVSGGSYTEYGLDFMLGGWF